MIEKNAILRKHIIEFLAEKRNIIYFTILIGCIGGLLFPVIFAGVFESTQLSVVSVFTIVLLKQWSAESFAAEKENKTLESILSTVINIKNLFWTKCISNLFFSSIIEYAMFILFYCVNTIMGNASSFGLIENIFFFFGLLNVKCSVVFIITRISLTSEDTRTANSRASMFFYVFIFLISAMIMLKTQNIIYANQICLFIIFLNLLFNIFLFIIINKSLKHLSYEKILV